MKEIHEKHFRSIPGLGVCDLCAHTFPSMFELASHIENDHPVEWTQALASSDRVERLQAKRDELLVKIEKVDIEIESEISSFRKLMEQKQQSTSRN